MNKHNGVFLNFKQAFSRLFIWLLLLVGIILTFTSFLPLTSSLAQNIQRSFGLSILSVGIVTLAISKYASDIIDKILKESLESAIQNNLQRDLKRLDDTVDNGIERIVKIFKQGLDKVENDMNLLSPLFSVASRVGLENVHLTRGTALENFAWFLDAEIQKATRKDPSKVWIISSSIKGFLEATSQHFDGRHMMEKIVQSGCDLRILMTDPKIANMRAQQERRADDEIPSEIAMNIAYLKRIGIKRENIRFYPGTPTVFAIATMDRMLLNPYPYQTEAFRCFTVIVQKTLNPESDIYHQYLRYHFNEPWERATEIPGHELWDTL